MGHLDQEAVNQGSVDQLVLQWRHDLAAAQYVLLSTSSSLFVLGRYRKHRHNQPTKMAAIGNTLLHVIEVDGSVILTW